MPEYIKNIQTPDGTPRPVKDAELTEQVKSVVTVTLRASGWSSSTPYTQSVSVSGMTSDSVFDMGIMYPDNCTRDNQKAINKAAGYIYSAESGDGVATFMATEKPDTDIPLGLRGIIS